MTGPVQIIIEADGSLELRLAGERAAHVPAAQAGTVRRLVDAAEGARAKALVVAGIVAGIALAVGEGRS